MPPWIGTWRPLEPGEIIDAGYNEFLVHEGMAAEMLNGGMTHVNGRRVSTRVVSRYPMVAAVQVRWTYVEEAA